MNILPTDAESPHTQRQQSISVTFTPSLRFKSCVTIIFVILSLQLTNSPKRYLSLRNSILSSSSSLLSSSSTTTSRSMADERIDRDLMTINHSSSFADLAKLAAQLHDKEQLLQEKENDLRNATATAPCSSGEKLYLASRPDVIQAIQLGKFTSGYQHWIHVGRKEGTSFTCANRDDGGSKDNNSQIQGPHLRSQPSSSSISSHPMCQRLMANSDVIDASVTASEIWIQNWEKILNASFFPYGQIDDRQRDIYRNMMIDIFPRLDDAVLTESSRQGDVQRIWEILEKRRLSPDESPPLRVLVLGGSVTEGVGCDQIIPSPLPDSDKKQERQSEKHVRGRACNWSVRLEQLVNSILGYNGVQIINVAQGGTATSQAIALVKYWIYPAQLEGKAPDVIIHAFGSNDSFLGMHNGDEKSRIHAVFENNVENLNRFVRTVFSAHSCPMPIIIHLDDYFAGHRQGAFLGDFTFRRVLTMISKWYGNLAVSSARVIGPLVYVDPLGEKDISPPWYIKKRGAWIGRMNEDPHFPYLGHQIVSLSMAYSFLHTALEFCEKARINELMQEKSREMADKRKSHILPRVEELKDFLPPPLDYSMNLETIGAEWWAERDRQLEHCRTTGNEHPCVMAWTAGPEGPTPSAAALKQYISPFINEVTKWKFEQDMAHGWARKLGIVAEQQGAILQLLFKSVSTPLRALTLQTMKSYGEKWENSEVEVEVLQSQNSTDKWTSVHNMNITGYHNSTASISYNTEMMFNETIQPGSDVRIKVTLIGGSTFKITGMMLCSR